MVAPNNELLEKLKSNIEEVRVRGSVMFAFTDSDKLVEKPSCKDAPSNLAVLGRYVLPPTVLDLLESTQVRVGGEIQLTVALDALLKIDDLNAFLTDASTFDCGN